MGLKKYVLNKKKPGNLKNKTIRVLAGSLVDSFDHLKTIYNEVKIGFVISQIRVLKHLRNEKNLIKGR